MSSAFILLNGKSFHPPTAAVTVSAAPRAPVGSTIDKASMTIPLYDETPRTARFLSCDPKIAPTVAPSDRRHVLDHRQLQWSNLARGHGAMPANEIKRAVD